MIDNERKNEFIKRAEMIETSIYSMALSWNWQLNQMKGIAKDTMESEYFDTYPVNWEQTELYTFEQL